jgi:hypothetical protein
MTKNSQIVKFALEHLGVEIDESAIEDLFKNEQIRKMLNDSQYAVSQDRFTSMEHGYSHRDDYWKIQETPKRLTSGFGYDSQGRKISHVQLFEEAAQGIMKTNPKILVKATRTGIRILGQKHEKKY